MFNKGLWLKLEVGSHISDSQWLLIYEGLMQDLIHYVYQ